MQNETLLNKNHWYDGAFYDNVVAPNQTSLFLQIKELINQNSSVLDVGCGTGHLSFVLAEKCKSLTGIDLSKRNISMANKKLAKADIYNLTFYHGPISSLTQHTRFDYATITYVLHEIAPHERLPLLNQMFQVADKVIIGDYATPQPKTWSGFMTHVVEFIAGADHFRNFKNFQKNGGLKPLIKAMDLQIVTEINNHTNTIFVLKKRTT